jgi:hypothetical protein
MKTQAVVVAEIVVEAIALAALAAGLAVLATTALDDPATLLGDAGILPAILLAIAVVGFLFLDIQSARRR